jgi:NTP pyrophosphatase (non-canonical NTP hydrolase)
MYNNDRCYVYNKAFARFFDNNSLTETKTGSLHIGGRRQPDRFDLIRAWANERGLYDKGDTKTQYLKLMEEAGELGRAILKNDEPEFIDAIGDMVVVLTNLARLGGVSIETCIDSAYDGISMMFKKN